MKVKFDDDYYKYVINKNKYDYCLHKSFDFQNLSDDEISERWLCCYNMEPIINSKQRLNDTIVTTGIGINGTPHLGTLSQILKAIRLQKAGFKVQFVLGDLDVYNARSKNLEEVEKIVKLYRKFVISLGFNERTGILRNQYDRDDIIKTAFLLSSCVRDSDFLDVEEDLSELYKTERIYNGMDFNIKESIMLMFADFIHLGMIDGYKNVLVMSGIDEHPYVIKSQEIIERMNINMNISGIFSKMIRGLNEYPKMSKSIKNSCINLDYSKGELKKVILGIDDDYDNPNDSCIYQLMVNCSTYSFEKLFVLKEHCKNKSVEWEEDKLNYIKDLTKIFDLWSAIK